MCVWVTKALEVIRTALGDRWVRTGRRYSLLQRAKKICQSAAVKKSSRSHNLWQDFAGDRMSDVCEPQSVTTTFYLNLETKYNAKAIGTYRHHSTYKSDM